MPKKDSGPRDVLRGFTANSKELRPEAVESRAQLDGFVDAAISSQTIGMRVCPPVYFIDDDRVFQVVTAKQLAGAGFIVQCYRSAEEFLRARRDDRTACVLVDYALPGMNGLELQKVLTKQTTVLPAIFVSASTDFRVSTNAMKAGAMDFLLKPVEEKTRRI